MIAKKSFDFTPKTCSHNYMLTHLHFFSPNSMKTIRCFSFSVVPESLRARIRSTIWAEELPIRKLLHHGLFVLYYIGFLVFIHICESVLVYKAIDTQKIISFYWPWNEWICRIVKQNEKKTMKREREKQHRHTRNVITRMQNIEYKSVVLDVGCWCCETCECNVSFLNRRFDVHSPCYIHKHHQQHLDLESMKTLSIDGHHSLFSNFSSFYFCRSQK